MSCAFVMRMTNGRMLAVIQFTYTHALPSAEPRHVRKRTVQLQKLSRERKFEKAFESVVFCSAGTFAPKALETRTYMCAGTSYNRDKYTRRTSEIRNTTNQNKTLNPSQLTNRHVGGQRSHTYTAECSNTDTRGAMTAVTQKAARVA